MLGLLERDVGLLGEVRLRDGNLLLAVVAWKYQDFQLYTRRRGLMDEALGYGDCGFESMDL